MKQFIFLFSLFAPLLALSQSYVPQPDLVYPIKARATAYYGQSTSRPFYCAIDMEGLKCWGYISFQVPKLRNTDDISASFGNMCSYEKVENKIVCWGDTSEDIYLKIPVLDKPLKYLSLGKSHACYVDTANKIECWGNNSYGQSKPPETLITVKGLYSGTQSTCAIDEKNKLVCWGKAREHNNIGYVKHVELIKNFHLGENSQRMCVSDIVYSNIERKVCYWDELDDVSMTLLNVNTSKIHSIVTYNRTAKCGIYDGKLLCWGEGAAALEFPQIQEVSKIALSANGACAFGENNSTCWANPENFSPIPDMTGVKSIHTSFDGDGNFYCAVKENSVECWGLDSMMKHYNIPASISTNDLKSISVGPNHFCIINGYNLNCYGAMSTPVADDSNYYIDLVSGDEFACGIRNIRDIKCWKDPRNPYGKITVLKNLGFIHSVELVSNKKICVDSTYNGYEFTNCWLPVRY